jgi:hypothetical protein
MREILEAFEFTDFIFISFLIGLFAWQFFA